MKLTDLTYFIFEVNGAIDRGRHQDISIAEVEEHIERGDLIPWLEQRLETDIDLSLFRLPENPVAELVEQMGDILGANKGRERRKWSVENSGLCLLVAWATEIIQRGDFEGGTPRGTRES